MCIAHESCIGFWKLASHILMFWCRQHRRFVIRFAAKKFDKSIFQKTVSASRLSNVASQRLWQVSKQKQWSMFKRPRLRFWASKFVIVRYQVLNIKSFIAIIFFCAETEIKKGKYSSLIFFSYLWSKVTWKEYALIKDWGFMMPNIS